MKHLTNRKMHKSWKIDHRLVRLPMKELANLMAKNCATSFTMKGTLEGGCPFPDCGSNSLLLETGLARWSAM